MAEPISITLAHTFFFYSLLNVSDERHRSRALFVLVYDKQQR